MTQNGNPIVTYYEGQPDMWNTKPPLVTWVQALFIKTIGLNELSVRLPSAIAALLTCAALLWFSLKYLNSFWFGFIAILVLMTSQGYVNMHGSRSGDYDAPLALFTTLYSLTFFAYIETKRIRHLYLTFIFIALAGLTKGVAGMLFLPALLIYAIIRKKVLPILKNKHTYIGLTIPIVAIVGFYLLRESQNPGFIQAVFDNELGGRYTTPKEGHYGDFYFYFKLITNHHFNHWYLLLLCGFLLGIFSNHKIFKNIAIYSTLLILTYLLVISGAATKLDWYDLPMYPFMALLATIFIHYIFHFLVSWKKLSHGLRFNILPTLFLLLMFANPYAETWDNTYWPPEPKIFKHEYQIGYTLKDAVDNRINLDGYKLLHKGSNTHWYFYQLMLDKRGQKLEFGDYKNLDSGDRVIIHQPPVLHYVDSAYTIDTLEVDTIRSIYFYRILE